MSLKRAVIAAAILLLAVPGVASAGGGTDSAGTDGVLINGSKLVTAVGGVDTPGAISVRFEDTSTALFYEDDNGVDASQAPGLFAIHENGTAYSADPWWGTAAPFFQTSAPVMSGDGSLANPWNVTSGFETRALGITQEVRHVDGSRSLRLTWTVTNSTNLTIPFKAFWNADLYVSGSDEGTGAFLPGPPRTLQGIAIDGTKASLIELTPWSKYYEGDWDVATEPAHNAAATYDNTFNPTSLDNGFGVQWNRTLAPHASTTIVLGFGASEPGGNPVPAVAPDITQSPVSGPSHSATFAFHAHAGDTATIGYECSLDGGQFDLCTSPESYTGIALGEHVFRVHGVNADGDFGPAASAMWTVKHRVVGSHPQVGLPAVAPAGHSIKVGCSLATGRIARCEVTLTTARGIVIGHAVRVFHGYHQRRHGKVEVVLTGKGRKLADQPGGVHVFATVAVLPVGGSTPLVARQTVHVVSSRVDVTPGALQFESGSAVLLPSGRGYLLGLIGQLKGARRVVATGYTDSLGSAAANYRLGLARADAVCAFISHRAHVACRAVAYGESHPRATNATAAGRALNRRVELLLTY